jgi:hypothetical protein
VLSDICNLKHIQPYMTASHVIKTKLPLLF